MHNSNRSNVISNHVDIANRNVIYSQSGVINEQTPGWKLIPADPKEKLSYNPAEGYYPAKGARLLAPISYVENVDYNFYQLSFSTLSKNHSLWGILFHDRDGNPIVSDIYSSVYGASTEQRYKQVFYGRENATGIQPFFQSHARLQVSDLEVKRITALDAANWCDRLYQQLPALSYHPPEKHLEFLPKTMKAMRSDIPWRVVMLGDSIINDTFNSNFQALLKRKYPLSDLRFCCSVRGSTGCWYYSDPLQFKNYVADLRPDLLIIGGISHRNDLESIRRVIVMARDYGCEIILASGPLGEDWREYDAARPEDSLVAQEWQPDLFVAQQQQLATDMQVEFLDLATPWNNYLAASLCPWGWFHRDSVHGNDRGKQIIGRIIERYFQS